jgi:S1-C subfamily serine protease
VTVVDFIIVGFAVIFGLVGFARGFVVGVLSLAGFIAGAYIGTRFGPQLLHDGNRSPYAPLFGLFGAIVAGSIISAGAEGIAGRMRVAIRASPLGALDGLLGAGLAVVLALGFAWVVGVIVLQTPGVGDLRKTVQRSTILDKLNEVLPSDTLLKALARFDPFPRIDGPEVDVTAPQSKVARDPDVQRAGDSVVKVLGSACGLGVSGSGWVARDGVVVTNAHVVAGQDDTVVELRDSDRRMDATAIAFDVHNDIAVLRVPDLEAAPLSFSRSVKVSKPAAVEGYPLSGPFQIRPARLGQTRVVISQDAYGRGPVRRNITAFRGKVQPGNSGGPLVDVAGRVAATVFAEAIGGRTQGGYAVPNEVVSRVLAGANGPVDTGPCVR